MTKQIYDAAFIRGFLKAADMMPQAPLGANNPPNQPQIPQIQGNSGGQPMPGQGAPQIPGSGMSTQQPPANGMGGFSMGGGNGNIVAVLQQIMQQPGNGMKPAPQAVQSRHIA
jgi:hypothetical protein